MDKLSYTKHKRLIDAIIDNDQPTNVKILMAELKYKNQADFIYAFGLGNIAKTFIGLRNPRNFNCNSPGSFADIRTQYFKARIYDGSNPQFLKTEDYATKILIYYLYKLKDIAFAKFMNNIPFESDYFNDFEMTTEDYRAYASLSTHEIINVVTLITEQTDKQKLINLFFGSQYRRAVLQLDFNIPVKNTPLNTSDNLIGNGVDFLHDCYLTYSNRIDAYQLTLDVNQIFGLSVENKLDFMFNHTTKHIDLEIFHNMFIKMCETLGNSILALYNSMSWSKSFVLQLAADEIPCHIITSGYTAGDIARSETGMGPETNRHELSSKLDALSKEYNFKNRNFILHHDICRMNVSTYQNHPFVRFKLIQ